jgi:hypothetical protein
MALATCPATGSSAAAVQTSRYETPGPVRPGSPPLAAANARQASLTDTITPSRSSSATSVPTSSASTGTGSGTRPSGRPGTLLAATAMWSPGLVAASAAATVS